MKSFWIVFILFITAAGSAHAQQQPQQSKNSQAPSAMPSKNQGEDTLFKTLNDTLEENRKIRTALKDLQQAYEKRTLESEDLKREMKRLESLALERNRELMDKAKQLEQKLKEAESANQVFADDKKEFENQKEAVRKETDEVRIENDKLRLLLANSILEEEKGEILKAAKENGKVAKRARKEFAELKSTNQDYQHRLAEAHYERGNALFQLQRYTEAAEAFRKVLELDPVNSSALHNLAVVEDYYLGDSKSAYMHYQRYLNYKPVDEAAEEVRRRILDLNLLQRVEPQTPLKSDFEEIHKETRNAKI